VSGRRSFVRVADALADILDRPGIGERIVEAGIVPQWPDRVGPALAAVTMPLRVSHGTLIVAVRSSAWLAELHLIEREIVRRLNAGRPRGRIERIRFVMMDPAAPDRRRRDRHD
jgi:predicted nucleic acid-binding Zn ribbon protein